MVSLPNLVYGWEPTDFGKDTYGAVGKLTELKQSTDFPKIHWIWKSVDLVAEPNGLARRFADLAK